MSSRFAALCLGIVVLGIAWARPHGPRPVAGEATAALLASSWAQDGDSLFSAADWRRGYGLWEEGALGVSLLGTDGEPSRYAQPWPFPAAAAVLSGLVGNSAAPLLGAALWLFLVVAAWFGAPERWAAVLVLGGSALLPMALRGDSALLPAVAGGLGAAWLAAAAVANRERRTGSWKAGLALAAAVFCEPLWAFPALGLAVAGFTHLRRDQWTRLLAAFLLATAALSGGQKALLGEWWPPSDGDVRLTTENFPFEGSSAGEPPTTEAQRYRPASAAGILREAGYLLAGRETGLLRLAPGALLVLFFSWRGPRRTGEARSVAWACLLGFVGAVAADLASSPGADRIALLSVVPCLLGWSPALPAPAFALAAALAAALSGLLTLPSLWGAQGMASRLPLELNRLDRLADRALVARGDRLWSIPKSGAYPEERRRHGVWLAGGADLDLILVSPRPLDAADLGLSSPVADHQAWIVSAAESVRVRFDSEAKRAGTPVRLALGPPRARDLDQFWPGGAEYYYRIQVRLDGGFIQHRLDGNRDSRSLGVFLAMPE